MNLGARTAAWSGGKLSAKSYVQDGLIAMWDGIENAGWGTHDATATTWKDLINNNDLVLYGNCSFSDNRIILSRSNSDAAYLKCDSATTISSANGLTIEYVICPSAFHNYSALVQFLPYAQTREGWIYSDGRVVPLRWVNRERSDFTVTRESKFTCSAVIRSSDFVGSFYKNGVAVGSIFSGGNTTMTTTISFYGANGYTFWGDAYGMRIYNRDLTAAEIAANYAVDKARFGLT